MEGVDYQVLRRNPENPLGGRPSNEYRLSVSCLEFFIARKVRAVFEVYRQVFHKSVNNTLSRKELAMMVIEAEEEKERLQAENEKQQKLLEEKTRENHNMMGKLDRTGTGRKIREINPERSNHLHHHPDRQGARDEIGRHAASKIERYEGDVLAVRFVDADRSLLR